MKKMDCNFENLFLLSLDNLVLMFCFFKMCLSQELKEDNRVLQETKEVFEDQLEGLRARSDKIHQLEKHSLLLKARIHDIEQVRLPNTKRDFL